MRVRIVHTTRYRYARPVSLEPHVLRLRPRCDGTQHLEEFRIRVQPRPCGWSEGIDLDGNAIAQAWFDGSTESLTVVSTAAVHTLRANPFDFLIEPWATTLPLRPAPERALALAAYQMRTSAEDSVTQFAVAVAREAAHQTIPFLGLLNYRLTEDFRAQVRPDGEPQPPALTLRAKSGACRDVAVLFIDACRALGLPARFVSGYYAGPVSADRRYLHAWAEVFLPGAGWRAFDPLQAVAVADQHVAVAASALPSGAAPVTGTFTGTAPSSSMEVDLQIETVDEAAASA